MPTGQLFLMQMLALFMFCGFLHVGDFLVVLALPDFLMMFFRHSLGVRQRAQLSQMLAPGFLFFRRQPDAVRGLRFCFRRGGRRMMVIRSSGGRISGSKNGKGDHR